MPDARTPLISKSQDAPGDRSAHLGVITALLSSAFLLFMSVMAIVSEAHLPHAIQSIISSLSVCSSRLGLSLSRAAAVELLLGTAGFFATTAVGLSIHTLYSRGGLKLSSKHNTSAGLHSPQARHGVSDKVGGLIKALGSAEERQRLLDEELEKDTITVASLAEEGRSIIIPPVENISDSSWRIHGMYEHQLLKAGLQHLDAAWPQVEILQFGSNGEGFQWRFGRSEKASDGSSALLRKRLFKDLLSGQIHLRSVPASDLAAAQGDVRRLSLAQLLRLRVLHIDFVPSGSGADTVSDVGSTHQAFMSLLDRLLFEQLGRKAGAGASNKLLQAAEAHRLGREVVLIIAAASSLSASPWWSWWVTPECRTFFHVKHFIHSREFASKEFPCDGEMGVLEVKVDRSRPDPHEPTGRLRWFDWSIELATSKAELSATPPHDGRGGQPGSSKESNTTTAPTISISVETLSEARRGLRQTGCPRNDAVA